MSRTIMLIPAEPGIGLTSVSLGVIRAIERKGVRLSMYKPISHFRDGHVVPARTTGIIRASTSLPAGEPLKMSEAEHWLSGNQKDVLMETLVAHYHAASQNAEVVLVEGLIPTRKHQFAQSLNVEIAKTLNAEIVLVMSHERQTPAQLHERMELVRSGLGRAKNMISVSVQRDLQLPTISASLKVLAGVNKWNNMVETQGDTEWLAQEVDESSFNDRRLGRRFRELMENFWKNIGSTIPFACQDWAGTKAAYRLLSNPHVDESAILQGHFESTRRRVATLKNETILLLQDTITFIYQRDNPDIIGYTGTTSAWGKRKDKSKGKIVNCGILMHSSLAITSRGVPLGLSAIKFWTRRKFKGTNALKRKINPTHVPIEEKESIRWLDSLRQSMALLQCPERCVHVGDRESDIYEMFCLSRELETLFLVRTCVDRLAGDGKHTISDEMQNEPIKCIHYVVLRDENEKSHEVMLSVRWKKILVKLPIGKSKQYPDITLFAIHAREENETPGRKPLEWKLLTNIPVDCNDDAIEKLEWYAHRWKIETFHKVLKSGCKAEDSKLRTAERLSKLISCFCIISWRIFWLTMVSREYSDVPVEMALTQAECELLDNVIKDNKKTKSTVPLQKYIIKLALLGGYLARANDPPPGNIVLWRGLRRLNDILYGFELSRE